MKYHCIPSAIDDAKKAWLSVGTGFKVALSKSGVAFIVIVHYGSRRGDHTYVHPLSTPPGPPAAQTKCVVKLGLQDSFLAIAGPKDGGEQP